MWIRGNFERDGDVPPQEQWAYKKIAFFTSGFVLMTLIINGLLLEPVYKWIGVYAKPTETQSLLYHSMEEVEEKNDKRNVQALHQPILI